MNTKYKISYLIFSLIAIVIFIISKTTINNKNLKKNYLDEKINNLNINKNNQDIITKIKYTASDNEGNNYLIESDEGYFSQKENGLINLTKVKATLKMVNENNIIIKSNKAIYNTSNNNTIFEDYIFIEYKDFDFFCDKIDFFFSEKTLKAYGNVKIISPELNSFADYLEINFITKKILTKMHNNKKIKIIMNYGTN